MRKPISPLMVSAFSCKIVMAAVFNIIAKTNRLKTKGLKTCVVLFWFKVMCKQIFILLHFINVNLSKVIANRRVSFQGQVQFCQEHWLKSMAVILNCVEKGIIFCTEVFCHCQEVCNLLDGRCIFPVHEAVETP